MEPLRPALSLVVLLLFGSAAKGSVFDDQPAVPSADAQTNLLALKAAWGAFSGSDTWHDGGDWIGITTDSSGDVTAIELSSAGLTGAVTTLLSKFPKLETMELRNNKLTGPIPNSIFLKLPLLQNILLAANLLTGSIPGEIFTAPGLQTLDLSDNSLSGGIPGAISQAANLVSLDLSSNSLTGPIPPGIITGCSQLMWLHLDNNKLSGAIPGKIYQLRSLQLLDLSSNQLTQGVPAGLWTMQDLSLLDLSNNRLGGKLPDDISKLQGVQTFSVANNLLTGPLPNLQGLLQPCSGDYSCYSSQVSQIDLSGNYFYGPPAASIVVPQRKLPAVTYQLCLQSDLPDQVSVTGNCLDASSKASNGATCSGGAQRPASECAQFCNTSTADGQCSGKGLCLPWYNGPRNRPPFACRCMSGYTTPKGDYNSCVPASP